jgi:hypothetical protein
MDQHFHSPPQFSIDIQQQQQFYQPPQAESSRSTTETGYSNYQSILREALLSPSLPNLNILIPELSMANEENSTVATPTATRSPSERNYTACFGFDNAASYQQKTDATILPPYLLSKYSKINNKGIVVGVSARTLCPSIMILSEKQRFLELSTIEFSEFLGNPFSDFFINNNNVQLHEMLNLEQNNASAAAQPSPKHAVLKSNPNFKVKLIAIHGRRVMSLENSLTNTKLSLTFEDLKVLEGLRDLLIWNVAVAETQSSLVKTFYNIYVKECIRQQNSSIMEYSTISQQLVIPQASSNDCIQLFHEIRLYLTNYRVKQDMIEQMMGGNRV